jgi:hypothetical protein
MLQRAERRQAGSCPGWHRSAPPHAACLAGSTVRPARKRSCRGAVSCSRGGSYSRKGSMGWSPTSWRSAPDAAIRRAASCSEQTVSSSASNSSAASPSRTGVGSIGRAMAHQRTAAFADLRVRSHVAHMLPELASNRGSRWNESGSTKQKSSGVDAGSAIFLLNAARS